MKKVVIVASLAAFATAAFAQSFTEGFEPTGLVGTLNGNTPGGDPVVLGSGTWHALNASVPLGVIGWFTNNTVFPPNTGGGALNVNFNSVAGANPINSFFMSPVRTFKNGDTISFFTRTVDVPGFPDRLHLKLSTSGSSTSATAFTTNLVTVNAGLTLTGYPSVYTQFSATLSGLPGAGVSGRFAFNYEMPDGGPAGLNSDFIGIDDVVYTAAPSSTVLHPSSYTIVDGMPFGGNVASLGASDDNKVFILNDESAPNATIVFDASGAPSAAGTIKVETAATRTDLSEFLDVFNFTTNAFVNVNFQLSSITDVTVTKPTTTANVSGTGAVRARIRWIPTADLEAADGWSETVDLVEWTIG